MSERLTTSQVAVRLGVAQPTVKLWCRQGRFPNAEIDETPRGPVWQIPESDLEGFEQPKMGRPAKAQVNGIEKPKATKKGGRK
jgi:predicted site-specific integrase-resolvase